MRARGLSVREKGILTPECMIEWQEFASYSCEEGTGKLTVSVHGMGLLRTLFRSKPASDTTKTWSIPTEKQAAIRQILAQKLPAQMASSWPVGTTR